MAGDGGNVGVVLANLLDAQQRRTQAEHEWVTARTEYQISFVDLQRAMGTLLINEAITPVRNRSDCSIEFIQNEINGTTRINRAGGGAGQRVRSFSG